MGKKKKAVGRPKKKNPKNTLIALRVTDREAKSLRSKAKKAGLVLSDYILKPHRSEKERE